jgi:hypothetical protein
MVADEYLDNTYAGWLTWYTNKRNLYKIGLIVTITVDVIVVTALPIAYYSSVLALKKFVVIAFFSALRYNGENKAKLPQL